MGQFLIFRFSKNEILVELKIYTIPFWYKWQKSPSIEIPITMKLIILQSLSIKIETVK